MMHSKTLVQRAFSHISVRIGLSLLFPALALVAYNYGGTDAAGPAATGVPQINAIYLADPAKSILDVKRAQAYGLQTVNTASALTAQATSADAIVIDGSLFPSVSQQWLATQLQRGRVIVGLDVPASRLEQVPGFTQSSHPAFREDWQGRPFFSLVYRVQDKRGLNTGTASDVVYNPDTFLRSLNHDIQAIRGTLPPPSGQPTPAQATAAPR